MSDVPTGEWPLEAVRDWLRKHVEEGIECPACTLFAKVYRHKIDSAMARTLLTMYRHAGRDFVHVPSLPGDTHKVSQLSWWGLVTEERVRRPDGGRAGWWALTDDGVEYALDRGRVPKYARIYDARVLSFTGDQVGIRDSLGTRFRYDDLMRGI